MGLAWQQGPLAVKTVGHFLTPEPMPPRLLFAEPLRRRMRVQLGEMWIADSQDVMLLHEPGRYPVAYFPRADIGPGILTAEDRTTQHPELGAVKWFSVQTAQREVNHAAWQYDSLPSHAAVLEGRVAFAWRAMDAFYEEDERIVGHAADFYHRIDIRSTSRHLMVRDGGQVIADTQQPLVLYESGFAPRWYVRRERTSPNRSCNQLKLKRSVPTKDWPATTTSVNGSVLLGRTSAPGPKWHAYGTWCPSNPTRSTCTSTAISSTSNRVRLSSPTASTAGWIPTRSCPTPRFRSKR